MNKNLKLFEELFINDEPTFTIGEKDFFNFIKFANSELTAKQRYEVLEIIINIIKNGDNK